MKKKFIWVKAEVLHKEEKVLTVRLHDGFGRAQAVVHQKNAITGRPGK